jgi:hypothetical protein
VLLPSNYTERRGGDPLYLEKGVRIDDLSRGLSPNWRPQESDVGGGVIAFKVLQTRAAPPRDPQDRILFLAKDCVVRRAFT